MIGGISSGKLGVIDPSERPGYIYIPHIYLTPSRAVSLAIYRIGTYIFSMSPLTILPYLPVLPDLHSCLTSSSMCVRMQPCDNHVT